MLGLGGEMIDYDYLRNYGMRPVVQKTDEEKAEDLHRMCAWCNTLNMNATECYCNRDCGKPLCVRTVEEFIMPGLPRFL